MEKTKLEKLYIAQDLSQREVAKKLSISQTSVRYYLDKYKIAKNKISDSRVNKDKICPKCNTFKLANEFYCSKRNSKQQAGSWCKACMKQQVLERQRKYKQQALDYKGGKCEICGYDKYQGALEFHHINPSEKDFELSKFSKAPLSDEGRKELDKCILLCANHHREAHSTG
jgi:predicted transcriptional regulator